MNNHKYYEFFSVAWVYLKSISSPRKDQGSSLRRTGVFGISIPSRHQAWSIENYLSRPIEIYVQLNPNLLQSTIVLLGFCGSQAKV